MTGNKTAKDILIEYLASKKYADNITITSHEIEEDVRKFGRHYYNKLHNASTYSRVWRTLKESGKIQELKDRRHFISKSQKRREEVNRAKYYQWLDDQQY